jgi:type VI secretion system protein ImpK
LDRIADVTRDCFNALVQLRRLDERSRPPPEAIHARLRGFVDGAMRRADQAGVSREDANDLVYPVVALADEVVLGFSEEIRQWWAGNLLQQHYFQENVAGEAFFTRLAAVRRDPRKAELLKVYYLALQLGFQGRYRVRGGDLELMTLTEELSRELARGGRHEDVLSPRGDRPQESVTRAGRNVTMLWVALAVVGLSLGLYVGLRISSSVSANALADRIASIQKR